VQTPYFFKNVKICAKTLFFKLLSWYKSSQKIKNFETSFKHKFPLKISPSVLLFSRLYDSFLIRKFLVISFLLIWWNFQSILSSKRQISSCSSELLDFKSAFSSVFQWTFYCLIVNGAIIWRFLVIITVNGSLDAVRF